MIQNFSVQLGDEVPFVSALACVEVPPVAQRTEEWYQQQLTVVNLDQLKWSAKPYYDYLNVLDPNWVQARLRTTLADPAWPHPYPWNPATPAEVNLRPANLGQPKTVFGLQIDRDADADNLADIHELKLGTDLNNPDTDGDGITDGTEVAIGKNPLKKEPPPPPPAPPLRAPDSDSDGIPDSEDIHPHNRILNWRTSESLASKYVYVPVATPSAVDGAAPASILGPNGTVVFKTPQGGRVMPYNAEWPYESDKGCVYDGRSGRSRVAHFRPISFVGFTTEGSPVALGGRAFGDLPLNTAKVHVPISLPVDNRGFISSFSESKVRFWHNDCGSISLDGSLPVEETRIPRPFKSQPILLENNVMVWAWIDDRLHEDSGREILRTGIVGARINADGTVEDNLHLVFPDDEEMPAVFEGGEGEQPKLSLFQAGGHSVVVVKSTPGGNTIAYLARVVAQDLVTTQLEPLGGDVVDASQLDDGRILILTTTDLLVEAEPLSGFFFAAFKNVSNGRSLIYPLPNKLGPAGQLRYIYIDPENLQQVADPLVWSPNNPPNGQHRWQSLRTFTKVNRIPPGPFTLNDNFGKSLLIQSQIPSANGEELVPAQAAILLPVEVKVNDTIKEEDDLVPLSKGTDEDLATDFSVKISGMDGLTADSKVKGADGGIKFKDQILTLTDGVEAKTKLWGTSPSSAKDKTIIEITLKKGGEELRKIEEEVTVFKGAKLEFEGNYYINIDSRDWARRPWDNRAEPKAKPANPARIKGYADAEIAARTAAELVLYKKAVDQSLSFGYESAISFKDGDNPAIPKYKPWKDNLEVKITKVIAKQPSFEITDDQMKGAVISMMKGHLDGPDADETLVDPEIAIADFLTLENVTANTNIDSKANGAVTVTAAQVLAQIAAARGGGHDELLDYLANPTSPIGNRSAALAFFSSRRFEWKNDTFEVKKGAKFKDSFAARAIKGERENGGKVEAKWIFTGWNEFKFQGDLEEAVIETK